VADEILNFVAFEESRFRWSHALHRHSRYALTDDQHFGCSPGDVLEEAVHGGQALVARANVVTSVKFEMLEKADDPFEGEVAECKTRDLAVLIGGSELQEQADRVAVAAHRGGS
jgi:hypothetical protein